MAASSGALVLPFLEEELHKGHPGITHMKTLTCSLVWWPQMDIDLENHVKQCLLYQANQSLPGNFPNTPDSIFTILGCFKATFLVVIDAYSKWLDVRIVNSTQTISVLSLLFATHSIPQLIVSDQYLALTPTKFACLIIELYADKSIIFDPTNRPQLIQPPIRFPLIGFLWTQTNRYPYSSYGIDTSSPTLCTKCQAPWPFVFNSLVPLI